MHFGVDHTKLTCTRTHLQYFAKARLICCLETLHLNSGTPCNAMQTCVTQVCSLLLFHFLTSTRNSTHNYTVRQHVETRSQR